MSQLFDLTKTPISPGITLIEASAGTGKTYAIAGIVVRLVIEREYSIGEILVVTFTEAATAELRERIRDRLRESLRLLQENRCEEEPALAAFAAGASEEDRKRAASRVKTALLSFDESAIFTIHGFCQRMLRENAFETGSLFDAELLTDPSPIWRETAEDFWRKRFYAVSPQIASVVVALQDSGSVSTDFLIERLQKISRHPELVFLTEDGEHPVHDCETKIEETIKTLRAEWPASSEAVIELLRDDKGISRNRKDGLPLDTVDDLAQELAALGEQNPLPPSTIHALRRLNPDNIPMKASASGQLSHRFLELCQDFDELLNAYSRQIFTAFVQYVQSELPAVKERRNILTFDDLLTRLYETLEGPEGNRLGALIGGRFRAALIDEFQDTDPVQWRIFERLFGHGEPTLFLIGDPKQAIYAFRGADIFTYLEARRKAANRFTLATNWRSDNHLVEAANNLFSQSDTPFLFPEITFHPVGAAPRDEVELDLADSGLAPQPLQLVCVRNEDDENLTAETAREMILDMLVTEIHQLLTCGIRRNEKLLEPGDIAVLVRSNREADAVRDALAGDGIPAVIRTDQSVLQTDEAEHLVRLLAAVLEPHKNGLIKSAISSPLFGITAEQVHEMDTDESSWQELAEKFYAWQERWNQDGFMRMFRQFLQEEGVKERILGLPDGERIVTNILHTAECLHQAEYELSHTAAALFRWLREQTARPESNSDSYIIRLEKDEKAVQIATVHRSKGLEYPIVFCPFNWTTIPGTTNRGRSKPDIIFHDPENENRLTWDLQKKPSEQNIALFRKEQIAEALRLLYVAVTRARSRCYLFWADTKEAGNPAYCSLAHVFGCDQEAESAKPFTAFSRIGDGTCAAIYSSDDDRAAASYAVERVDPRRIHERHFTRALPATPLVTSFSGLTSRAHEILPDRDPLPGNSEPSETLDTPEPGISLFTFPKGARAGNFFHSLLEEIDFMEEEQISSYVHKWLRAFDMDSAYSDVITKQIQDLLCIPLPGESKPVLAEVPLSDRLIESAFYFPIRPVKADALAGIFRESSLPAGFADNLGRLEFRPVDGYMTGFIDLIFRRNGRYYIIDWKSNWLGPSLEFYSQERIRQAMTSSYYFLQYHLYTVALDRHLKRTLPGYSYENDFGGIYYIFLRGINPRQPGSGIFFDRPAPDLIGRLGSLLEGNR